MRFWSVLLVLLLAGCSGDLSSVTTEGGSGEVPTARVDSSSDEQLRSLTSSEYRVTFKPGSDWGQGFTAEIEIVNLTGVKVSNWRLEFDFAHEITSIWNGKIVSHTGTHYVISGESYNAAIAASGSVKFGFQGTPGGVKSPTGFKVTGDTVAGGGTTTGAMTGSTTGTTTGSTTGGTTGSSTGGSGSTSGASVAWKTDDDWGSGFVGTVTVANAGPGTLSDWQVEVQFSGTITGSWNCKQISRNGNVIRFGPADYNRSVPAGSSVTFGFQGTPGRIPSLPVTLVGGGTSTGGTTTGSTTGSTTGGTTGSTTGSTTGGTTGSTTGGTTGSTTGTTTGGTTGGGTTGSTTGGPVVGTGYLHTSGARILDDKNNVVRLTGVNWFGLETDDRVPHGLWSRSLDSMMAQIASEGYNTIRLPYCNRALEASSVPTNYDRSQNPDLVGKTSLQIMDKVIERAQFYGVKVILDRHRPTGAGQSALWYTSEISEERWISDWEMLARRYQNNPTVVGFDLHNEPHSPATWGDGSANDWRLAAQRCGNRILAINPKLLIIVEGVDTTGGRSYWWGGNLKSAGAFPVVLSVPNQLVYQTHDYPQTVYNQSWFSAPNYPGNLSAIWDECWGYLVKGNIAPVLVGEFGTRNQTTVDKQWLTTLTAYMKTNGVSFTYWSWNPNSTDTGGLLADDWRTVLQDKKAILAPLLAPLFK